MSIRTLKLCISPVNQMCSICLLNVNKTCKILVLLSITRRGLMFCFVKIFVEDTDINTSDLLCYHVLTFLFHFWVKHISVCHLFTGKLNDGAMLMDESLKHSTINVSVTVWSTGFSYQWCTIRFLPVILMTVWFEIRLSMIHLLKIMLKCSQVVLQSSENNLQIDIMSKRIPKNN